MYVGEGEELDPGVEMEKLDHPHHIKDLDDDWYWHNILRYLGMNQLPDNTMEANKVRHQAQHFFVMDRVLWHRNGTKPPLLVILSHQV